MKDKETLNVITRAVLIRVRRGEDLEEALARYTALTDEEKAIIRERVMV